MKKLKHTLRNVRIWLRINVNFIVAARNIASYKDKPTINGKSEFNGKTHLGSNILFNCTSITGKGTVAIGDKLITPDTVIDENVCLGSRVIILPGVNIGYGAIVQAGSFVVDDVESLSIVGGHPAKPFSSRNTEHYFGVSK